MQPAQIQSRLPLRPPHHHLYAMHWECHLNPLFKAVPHSLWMIRYFSAFHLLCCIVVDFMYCVFTYDCVFNSTQAERSAGYLKIAHYLEVVILACASAKASPSATTSAAGSASMTDIVLREAIQVYEDGFDHFFPSYSEKCQELFSKLRYLQETEKKESFISLSSSKDSTSTLASTSSSVSLYRMELAARQQLLAVLFRLFSTHLSHVSRIFFCPIDLMSDIRDAVESILEKRQFSLKESIQYLKTHPEVCFLAFAVSCVQ